MNKPKPTHAPMNQFQHQDGCLMVGGIPLTRLARMVGQTPFYAYDRALISARIQQLRSHLPERVHIHYAIKANPMPAVVQHLSNLVDGFDLASHQEMLVALDTTMPASEISIAGPGKSMTELRAATAAGIVINVESKTELDTLLEIGAQTGDRPKIAIRVNPDFELKSSGMKMGGGPKQFGVDVEKTPELLHQIKRSEAEFVGFHIFSGSQNLRAESIMEAQEKTLELASRLANDAPGPIRKLNIGGGFGIPYFPGELPLQLAPIGENLDHLLKQYQAELGKTEIILELGRYIVGEAGIYVCEVLDRKISREQVFLVCNGGLHHHLAASGNFGQIIRKNYPVQVGNRMNASETEIASVVGPLCTPLDLLADNMQLAKAVPGDLIVVFQSGAYGLTASPSAFLSHPAASEILV